VQGVGSGGKWVALNGKRGWENEDGVMGGMEFKVE